MFAVLIAFLQYFLDILDILDFLDFAMKSSSISGSGSPTEEASEPDPSEDRSARAATEHT